MTNWQVMIDKRMSHIQGGQRGGTGQDFIMLKIASNFKRPPAAAAKSPQSCPTLCDPIDGSPSGSPRPWDAPGKNTEAGCHFLLQCMKV